MHEVSVGRLLQVQAELDKIRAAAPRTQLGGRNGLSGNAQPGAFGPVLDGTVLSHHPFDPGAPAIKKNKPLMVGYNRDEMNFFFNQTHSTDVYELTDATLEVRVQKDFGADGPAMLKSYRASRAEASAPDLFVAMATARISVAY